MAKLQLTIDDGPQPVRSALIKILDELDRSKAKAAFFVIGKEVVDHHGAIALIRKRGHVIANHSWEHLEPRTQSYSDEAIHDSFRKCHVEVRSAGVQMEYWRAPRGEQKSRVGAILKKRGLYRLTHSDWHADSKDSQGVKTADGMLREIRRALAPYRGTGSRRLLFHVTTHTARAFPTILAALKKDGHTFVEYSQSQ